MESHDASVRGDGRVQTGDSGGSDDAPAATAGHLLLTEVALAPPGAEFVEIHNPGTSAVSLAHYYLADNGDYWKLPAGAPNINISDFIVQFPATAMIPAGGTITVTTGTAATFMTAYGSPPTYAIGDNAVTKVDVPGTPTLTDAGEIIVLFQWDGAADLVADVDMVIAGVPTATNTLVSKSGAMQGSSSYKTDANSIMAQTATPAMGTSTKRIMAEDGNETQAGTGNGITGDDETSENTRVTWDSTFTAPTPGAVPTL
jgi:hypothetical protein